MLSKTTRILLVVAVLAAAAWLWVQRGSRTPEGDAPDRLAQFDRAAVDGVVLRRGEETLRFVRTDSLWEMTEPVSDRAEPSAVISLLDALERADIARDLGQADDLAPFGLDPPLARITLFAGADTVLDASIGKRTVDDAWSYARSKHRDLVLVPTDVARAATQPVAAYRNRRVLDFQLRDVARYALSAPDHATAWRRCGDGWCAVEHGDTVAGDSVAVDAVLRRVRGLRVASFIDAPDTLLGAAGATLTLVQPDGARIATVRFAKRGAHWVAAIDRDHRTVTIDDDVSDLVAHTTTDLRERRLLQFSPTDAMRIVISLPGVSGELVRAAGHWAFPNPSMGRVDANRAADLVRALRSLKWDDPSGPAVAMDSGFSILIEDTRGGILDEVSFRAPATGTLWVARSRSDGTTRRIDAAKLDHLAALFQQLRTPSGSP
ncbi:MAG TPA: DUF4340 domain-containing protein [Candidatus Krumholzibacteria bacterium]